MRVGYGERIAAVLEAVRGAGKPMTTVEIARAMDGALSPSELHQYLRRLEVRCAVRCTGAAKLPVVRKLRDGREPELFPYMIEDQSIGFDDDGFEIMAGVAVTVEPIEIENEEVETEMKKNAKKLKAEGKSLRDIGRALQLSKSTVSRLLNGRGGAS